MQFYEITRSVYGEMTRVVVDDLKSKFGLKSDGELCKIAGIKSTVPLLSGQLVSDITQNYLTEEQSSLVLGRLRKIDFIFRLAATVLNTSDDKVRSWFNSDHRGLGDSSPISLLSSDHDLELVDQLLNQIYYGIYH